MTSCMLTGFVSVHDRENLLGNSAGYSNTTGKMYPYSINPNTVFNAGKTFSQVCYKIPSYITDRSVPIVTYTKVYNDYYVYIITLSNMDTSVILPTELWNRKSEVVMSDGIISETTNILNSIDVKSNGIGYMIVKLKS